MQLNITVIVQGISSLKDITGLPYSTALLTG